MSTNTTIDFQTNITALEKSSGDIINTLIDQGDFLNSNTINNNFINIEKYLNTLYENIRVLEDSIDYAKVYVNNEISQIIIDCKKTLNDIENLNDYNYSSNKNFVLFNVPIINSNEVNFTDRDGSTLKPSVIYNNLISLCEAAKNPIEIQSVTLKSNELAYDNNLTDLINNKAYRSYYILNSPVTGGIIEIITFFFKGAIEVNSVRVALSNCSLLNMIYIYEDNTESYDTDISKGITPTKKVIGVRLTLNSTNYSKDS